MKLGWFCPPIVMDLKICRGLSLVARTGTVKDRGGAPEEAEGAVWVLRPPRRRSTGKREEGRRPQGEVRFKQGGTAAVGENDF